MITEKDRILLTLLKRIFTKGFLTRSELERLGNGDFDKNYLIRYKNKKYNFVLCHFAGCFRIEIERELHGRIYRAETYIHPYIPPDRFLVDYVVIDDDIVLLKECGLSKRISNELSKTRLFQSVMKNLDNPKKSNVSWMVV